MGNFIAMLYVKLLIFLNIIAEFLRIKKNKSEGQIKVPVKNIIMKRISSSSANLNNYCNDFTSNTKLNPDQDDKFDIDITPQNRDTCKACRIKIYHEQIEYFAFDTQYCGACWKRLSQRLVVSKNL